MMKWGPMRVTVTSNVNFDSWLMNIKIVGAVHYLVIGPHCLNASECHFVGQKSLLIPSPASCPVHSAVQCLLACLPRLYWCTWWADGQAVRRRRRRRRAARCDKWVFVDCMSLQIGLMIQRVVSLLLSCLALPISPPGQSNMNYIYYALIVHDCLILWCVNLDCKENYLSRKLDNSYLTVHAVNVHNLFLWFSLSVHTLFWILQSL